MTATAPVAATAGRSGIDLKVGDLARGEVLTASASWPVRVAVIAMSDRGVGSIVVLDDDGKLVGIFTERDLLRGVAAGMDLDGDVLGDLMTREVVTAARDWEVYEAAAEMHDRHIRHLVVVDGAAVIGVLSIRDLLLAGQRIALTDGAWAVLRDPLTLTIRERRRLQTLLRDLDPGPLAGPALDGLVALLVATWSFSLPLPTSGPEAVATLDAADRKLLEAALEDELPGLQRAVHPAPGWRSWREP
ncbi:MAG: CBS domain-containing protein [Iamia sp.]